MIYGVIDLGSNTIRLSIFKYDGSKIKLLTNKKEIVGLATYTENGILTEEGISKACKILNKFKIILQNSPAKAFSVVATASLRNIKNREEVVEQIKIRTGMLPEVLQGEEEARLGFLAIQRYNDISEGVMIDIGGGSTELVVFEDKNIVNITSIPIGALNLQNKNVQGIVATKKEYKNMKKIINAALDKLGWEFKSYQQMYAVGGTARAVLNVSKELLEVVNDSRSFSAENLRHIMKRVKSSDIQENKSVYHIVPERIFSFCGGIVILNEIVKRFGIETVNVSKNGIRDGYFLDRIVNPIVANHEKVEDDGPAGDFISDAVPTETDNASIGENI